MIILVNGIFKQKGCGMGMRYVALAMLLVIILCGCQRLATVEVVNNHGEIQYSEGLKTFAKNVKEGKSQVIDYVSYGIEGQRVVHTMDYTGKLIEVTHSVDGELIEEYVCGNFTIIKGNDGENYSLEGCDFEKDGKLQLAPVQ